MRLLVFGRTGQVATELGADRPGGDVPGPRDGRPADAGACEAAVEAAEADAVINAAAWTAVDAAEEHREAAFAVNGAAPGAMARACAARGLPFVHISTDYVFDGSGDRPWRPEDPTSPLGAYGASKLAGEEEVRAAGGAHAILRTSWVFSAHGSNFVKTMLRLGAERERLRIVADQFGGPDARRRRSPQACLAIAEALTGSRPLGHLPLLGRARRELGRTSPGRSSTARGLSVAVEDIPSSAYPTPAPRPLNSRLDCCTTETAFGIAAPRLAPGARRCADRAWRGRAGR